MSRAWTKLINTQLKDVTSDDLAKLGQNMFVDPNAILEFESLQNLVRSAQTLQTPGQDVFADSLKIFSKSASSGSATIKPSDIYSSDVDSDTYLVKLLGYAVTANDLSATFDLVLTDGVTTLPIMTSGRMFDYQNSVPDILLNEGNYIQITEGGGFTVNFIGLYGIVARGGAQ